MENSTKMKFVGMEGTTGLTESSTRASGSTTKCTDRALWFGRIARSIKASSLTTNERAGGHSVGPMGGSTWVSGELASNMEEARTSVLRASENQAFGKMVRNYVGLTASTDSF
jgi:hypothetical protein